MLEMLVVHASILVLAVVKIESGAWWGPCNAAVWGIPGATAFGITCTSIVTCAFDIYEIKEHYIFIFKEGHFWLRQILPSENPAIGKSHLKFNLYKA